MARRDAPVAGPQRFAEQEQPAVDLELARFLERSRGADRECAVARGQALVESARGEGRIPRRQCERDPIVADRLVVGADAVRRPGPYIGGERALLVDRPRGRLERKQRGRADEQEC